MNKLLEPLEIVFLAMLSIFLILLPDRLRQFVVNRVLPSDMWARNLQSSGACLMTTLAANTPRAYELGNRNHIPVIASDIIYEGAAVGVVAASGHARPLAAGDLFAGFAVAKADNSSGAAAAINVEVEKTGQVQLSVSGAVITDVGQPVYATDDDTFVFLPTGGVFIGFVKRFVSSGVVVVEYDAGVFKDPYLELSVGGVYETLSASTKTLDIQDNGKVFFVTVDSVVTLPAVATPVTATLVCMGAYGTVQISVDPNTNDKIHAPDIAGTNDKDHINTKATAQRGDYVTIGSVGDADGPAVIAQRGTWAQEG